MIFGFIKQQNTEYGGKIQDRSSNFCVILQYYYVIEKQLIID